MTLTTRAVLGRARASLYAQHAMKGEHMRQRKKMPRKASQRQFRNAAKIAVHKNLSSRPRRGGIRM